MQTEQIKTFNVAEAIAAQKKLQQEKSYPDFAPGDGLCYDCRRQIYQELDTEYGKTGISVESAAAGLVTGCPHCHHSYVD